MPDTPTGASLRVAPPPASAAALTVPIPRRRITRVLSLGVLLLAAAHLLGLYSVFVLNQSELYGAIDRFHLDGEANVPAWYAALLLLACAATFGLIAAGKRAAHDRFARQWAGLALILLYLSADEGAQFHELLTGPTRELAGGAGAGLRSYWVIPGALLALAVGLVYLRFLAHLPPPVSRRFVAAGAVFLAGAVGMEAVGDWYLTTHGAGPGYHLLAGAEEVIEKAGAILALDAALAYLATQTPVIRLALHPDEPASSPRARAG